MKEQFFVPGGVERVPDDTCAEDLFGEGDDDERVHVEAGAGDCGFWVVLSALMVFVIRLTILQPRQITRALDLEHDDPDDIIRLRSGEVVVCLFIRP